MSKMATSGMAADGKLAGVMDTLADQFSGAIGNINDCDVIKTQMAEFGMMSDKLGMSADKKKNVASKVKDNAECFGKLKDDIGMFGDMMGDMVEFFDPTDIAGLSDEAFMNATAAFGHLDTMDDTMAGALLGKAKDTYGDFASWDPDMIGDMTGFVSHMSPQDMMMFGPRALGGLAGAAADFTADQVQAIADEMWEMPDMAFDGLIDAMDKDAFKGSLKNVTSRAKDMTKDQRKGIKDKALDAFGDLTTWGSEVFSDMGDALGEFPVADLMSVDWTMGGFGEHAIETMGEIMDWTQDELGALAGKCATTFGDAADWEMSQFEQMGGLMNGLAADVVSKIPKDKMKAAIESATSNLDAFMPGTALFDRAKDEFSDVAAWTVDEIHMFGGAVDDMLNITSIADMADDVFEQGIDTLRKAKGWAKEEFAELANKGKKVFGGNTTNMTRDQGKHLGEMIAAWPKDDIMEMHDDAFLGALEESADDFLRFMGGEFDNVADMEMLKPGVVEDALDTFLDITWDPDETHILADKVKESFGAITSWTKQQCQKADKIL